MKTTKTIPELRFPEFEGEWIEKSLDDIATILKGKGISKNDLSENGATECILYGELYTHYSEIIDDIKSKTNIERKSLVFSRSNDVIIPASGETQIDIATASCVIKDGIALGGDLNIIRGSANGVFLSFYLNNKKKKDIAQLAQGISVVHLYGSQLKGLILQIPSLPEQQKIASFLSAADQRLQLLYQKKKKLEQYKKGIMQQIFSQQLRFKDENGKDYPEWEEKKISDVFSITRGYVLSFNEIMQEKDKIYKFPVYSSQTKNNGLSGYYYKSLYSNAITWTTDGANAGEVRYREGNFYCTNVCGVLVSKEGYANECIASMLNSVTKKYVSYVGNPKLMNNVMGNISILFPSIDEQQKIASFLSSLDQKISLVNQQIELTRRWKQGLLQKMFV